MRISHLVSSYSLVAVSASLYAEICPQIPAYQRFGSIESLRLLTGGLEQCPRLQKAGQDEPRVYENEWQGPHMCISKYCVWSTAVAEGEALSVVTIHANSQRLQHLNASSNNLDKSNLFRTVRIPGKGMGMVADKIIVRGEQVLEAKPAVLVHMNLVDDLGVEDQHRLLETAVGLLPPARQQQFLAQAGEFGGHRINDTMFTNSFQINLGGQNGQHFGNFPEVSRFNHDCRPNVAFYIDENLVHHTHAIRDIQPGEELTISYLDSFRAREIRQVRAHSSWGFACTCSQCSLPKEEADASDARLYSIYRIENQLADLGNKNVTPDMIEQLINLYEEERLNFKLADAYTIAALNYNLFGLSDMATKYASLSIEQGLLEHGPNAPDIGAMRLLLADAEGHWTFNRRPYTD